MDENGIDLPLSREVAKVAAKEQIEEHSWAMEMLNDSKESGKRLYHALIGSFIVILILIIALVVSNFYWIHTFTQYDFVSYSQDVSDGGDANFIGGDGDINSGKTNDSNQD